MKKGPLNPQSAIFKRPSRVGLFVLAGLVLAAYANIVFSGETLVATSNYHPFDYRFDRLRTGNVAPPAFTNWHDEGSAWWQWEPAAKSSARRPKGRFPSDPTIAGGVDAHVNATRASISPHVLPPRGVSGLRTSLLLCLISGACLPSPATGFHLLGALLRRRSRSAARDLQPQYDPWTDHA